eukprot:gene22530-27190_t
MGIPILDALISPFVRAIIPLVGSNGNATIITYALGVITATGLGVYAYGLPNLPSQAIAMVGSLASFYFGSFLANGRLGATSRGGFGPDFSSVGLLIGAIAALFLGVMVGIVFPPGSTAEKVAFAVAAVLAIYLGYVTGS